MAYEVVDLVKPDPIKEENIVTNAIKRVKQIGSNIVKKYQETEAAKKKFRDNNPGGTVSKSTYQQSVKDGTSSQY